MTKTMREELANLAHQQWSGWMDYLFDKCEMKDGDLVIPRWGRERWQRQINTSYEELPEMEKESDRKEADKMILIFISQLQSVFEEIKTQHLIDTDCVEKFEKLRQKYCNSELEVKNNL